MTGDRAQAHTLEGFVAALLILSSIVFALQATAVTPLTASTSNQNIENQQRAAAEGLLAAAASNGTLEETALAWNASTEEFANSTNEGAHTNGTTVPTPFGNALEETFGSERIAFNVYIGYRTPAGESSEIRMVFQGSPSDNAVSASRLVPIYDDSELTGTSTSVDSTSNFYASDVDPDGPLYNVLEVRIVVWRI